MRWKREQLTEEKIYSGLYVYRFTLLAAHFVVLRAGYCSLSLLGSSFWFHPMFVRRKGKTYRGRARKSCNKCNTRWRHPQLSIVQSLWTNICLNFSTNQFCSLATDNCVYPRRLHWRWVNNNICRRQTRERHKPKWNEKKRMAYWCALCRCTCAVSARLPGLWRFFHIDRIVWLQSDWLENGNTSNESRVCAEQLWHRERLKPSWKT